jgi:type IV pilus assembly protein PilC
MALSTVFNEYWHLVLITLALLIGAFIFALRTPGGRYVWDRMKLQVPMIGPVMQKAALSRFASIFSILQASGVGIMDSVKILAGAIGNAAIARELATMEKNLEQGRGVARPLMQSKFFTPMFVNMVAIGEEAGNLDEMLREVSNHYDAEVEFATRRLTTAMGPILMVGLAAMVGFFALAVYMPMWDLAKMAGKG